MNLPYGISNFAEIRRGRYFYADKTAFIPVLEDPRKGRRYLSFLRPRRFGKSTLLSMLEHYYDILQAPHFDELFGGLAIARDPTPDRGRFAVLRLEFTGLSTEGGLAELRAGFHARLHNAIHGFLRRYRDLLPEVVAAFEAGLSTGAPASLMERFLGAMRQGPHPLYVLVDEYDNFANDIIGRGQDQAYHDIILAGGFVREFYKTLKEGTATGVVGRIFMTGVSPIMLNDLTSGFNILNHISQDEDCHALCGLTAGDVGELLDGVLASGGFALSRDELLGDLKRYYNGYLFTPRAAERLYNPDMVLYFMKGLTPPAQYPMELLDANARTDYKRLDSLLFTADRKPRPHPVELIRAVLSEGYIDAEIHDLFPLVEAYDPKYFASYLHYLGLLTIQRREQSRFRLVIPNYVIEHVYGETLNYILQQTLAVEVLPAHVKAAVDAMAYQGEIEPFLRLLHGEVLSRISNRDLIRMDEKSVKLLMLGYLSLSHVFFPFSEFEVERGYSDLILTLNRSFSDASYSFLIELKYVKPGSHQKGGTSRKSGLLSRVEASMREADRQIDAYLADPRLAGIEGPRGWKAVAVVFAGTQAIYFRERGGEMRSVP
jgi:hypothetical protein